MEINKINEDVQNQKGFDEGGCYNCNCNDSCCKFGADFDKLTYDTFKFYRKEIEQRVGVKLEDCFEKEFSGDEEFLGKNSIRSLVINNYCIFHKKEDKGCILYEMVNTLKLNKVLIPSICRLFPLTWDNKILLLSKNIPTDCNCLDTNNKTNKKILETQQKEIDSIFDIIF